jgi:hypothetical protein
MPGSGSDGTKLVGDDLKAPVEKRVGSVNDPDSFKSGEGPLGLDEDLSDLSDIEEPDADDEAERLTRKRRLSEVMSPKYVLMILAMAFPTHSLAIRSLEAMGRGKRRQPALKVTSMPTTNASSKAGSKAVKPRSVAAGKGGASNAKGGGGRGGGRKAGTKRK